MVTNGIGIMNAVNMGLSREFGKFAEKLDVFFCKLASRLRMFLCCHPGGAVRTSVWQLSGELLWPAAAVSLTDVTKMHNNAARSSS